MKINPKMGFWRAKQGLSKTWDLKNKLVSFVRRANHEKREEEEEEEEEDGGAKIKQKGMESNFGYGFLLWNSKVCMNFHAIGWLLVIPKPRVCWDFIITKEVLKLKLVKFKKGTRWL